jgi:hypothetical protein
MPGRWPRLEIAVRVSKPQSSWRAIDSMFMADLPSAHGSLQALKDLFGGEQVVQMLWADLLRMEDGATDPLL